ncbi:dTDP-4-dehydrorhamnose reductase [Microbacterium testaceum]|uniref:dTDP-4-dehydrorhamnose reductase n=1 Tax=Microbacterium testaceum TaxID=2033 RepID=UPI00124830E1|nr:dTDP-4-dehydrorhamnose reductase [Microbacterium testaceum]
MQFGKALASHTTSIPGLLVIDLPVHGDDRGWFKENWQRQKMTAADIGLPDFAPVQNNISFNDEVGTTRGIHAEPWDKLVSVASGRIFGAWVDLREGESFGSVFSAEIDPSTAIFVPRGVGNSYQTLEADTAYSYLVNDHWAHDATYTFLNLADETVAIDWPIPLDRVPISQKDRVHPRLADVVPMPPKKILVVGADGQLGRALEAEFGRHSWIEYAGRDAFDLSSDDMTSSRRWRDYTAIVNAAGFTDVDGAETHDGRAEAWATNVSALSALARVAVTNDLLLVHVSSDYVFDGRKPDAYTETDRLSPLGVYGQTKAAGEAVASVVPRHYILRTSWLIGDGANFVKTMVHLAQTGAAPTVVDDQVGSLTFARDLAKVVKELLETRAPYGIYNFVGREGAKSWFGWAQDVFAALGHDPARVAPIGTASYSKKHGGEIAPRPANSILSTQKIEATLKGLTPTASLADYLESINSVR